MKNKSRIAILMSTYNGEKFLREQIDSILSQSFLDWTLYIHDDGSTDQTADILKEYSLFDRRIVFIDNSDKHMGPGSAFLYLLNIVESDLYMFCDQDDIWLKDKIKISYERYLECFKPNTPIIIHTDVTVVDNDLKVLAKEYWKDINLNPDRINTFDYNCICHFVNGNTMLFNNNAKLLCQSLPNGDFLHDEYLTSRVFENDGIVNAIHIPLVLYRQHSINVCGFRVGKEASIIGRLMNLKQVISTNIRAYSIYSKRGYGNLFKYVWVKILIEIHMHLRNNY